MKDRRFVVRALASSTLLVWVACSSGEPTSGSSTPASSEGGAEGGDAQADGAFDAAVVADAGDAGNFDAADAAPRLHSDISAGRPPACGAHPSAAIDRANGKLLVVTEDIGFGFQETSRPTLFRCNLDGTACTHTDISAGQAQGCGIDPALLVDAVNSKLLLISRSFESSFRSSLIRCNLDGTSCTHADISAGEGVSSGYSPSPVIDSANGKLLVVTMNTQQKPSLFRCNLDGTSCVHSDISAGQGSGSGLQPSAVIDTVNGKLLAVTNNVDKSNRASLFRCDLDGTSCTHTDISAGEPGNSGNEPSAVIDAVNGKLLVVTANTASSGKPSLFRCNLDGTSCAHTDISAGQGASSGDYPSAVVDAVNGKLLVVTQNGGNSFKPSLFRCNLDGTSCTHTDVSAGQGPQCGQNPFAMIDSANGKLLVVADDGLKPGLFLVPLK